MDFENAQDDYGVSDTLITKVLLEFLGLYNEDLDLELLPELSEAVSSLTDLQQKIVLRRAAGDPFLKIEKDLGISTLVRNQQLLAIKLAFEMNTNLPKLKRQVQIR